MNVSFSRKNFQKSSIFLVILVVIIGAVSVFGAPSNSTTSAPGSPKKPSRSTTTSSGSISKSTTTRTTTTKRPPKGKNNSTSSSAQIRLRREDHPAEVEIHTGSHTSGSIIHDKAKPNNATVTRGQVRNDEDHHLASKSGATNSTHHAVRRSTDDDQATSGDDQATSGDDKKPEVTDSHHSIPSTHPLFGARQSSNLTASLRPKLKTRGGSPAGSEEDATSGHEEGESSEEKVGHHHRVKATSQEETVSVSTGTIAFTGGNSGKNSSVKGFASGTGGHKKERQPEVEEEDLFIV